MSVGRARGLGALFASVVVTATVLSASGGATAAPSTRTALNPAAVAESVRYLVDSYGVSEREALRRLALQDESARLDRVLRTENAAEYGGMWLDQTSGELVVAMTDPAAARRHLEDLPDRSRVRTQAVRHSLADLNAAKDRIAAKVGAGPDAVYLPAVDERANEVVLWERAWVAREKSAPVGAASADVAAAGESVAREAVAREADAARRAVSEEPKVAVRAKVLPKPNPLAATYPDRGYCHPLACAGYGPMRGGLRLDMKRDDETWGGCTAGFNLRSTGGGHPGKAWVLTAGHCMATKTNNTPTRHNGVPVLQQHGIERNSYPYDYAAVLYVDTPTRQTWLENHTGRNRVLKYCWNGGMDSNIDTPCGEQEKSVDEYITGTHGLAEVKAGWVVCATGSASNAIDDSGAVDSGAGKGYRAGTRCGRVLSTDVGINTDLCARRGDSGGPLFSQVDHTALGILEGNQQSRSGACAAGELNNYVPIDTILTDIHTQYASLRSKFSVITTPNG
ncbi:S1 family peptidase [Saccharothrix sp. S26]|uniref:S1 family peptidase n=1 Tax=Saccharothrix sp. S26 TaxID=2907215 RepID=UPI001F32FB98|nr:S1 family peptidase [Saccharothrix sp. S26]MCE6996600.1 S1 family peptidase [Saccharothrix sp. S26]